MITPQLIKYINDRLSSGSTKEIIKSSLMANGWSSQDLEGAFRNISGQSDIPLPYHKPPIKREILLSMGFITASLIYVFAQYANGVFESPSIPTTTTSSNTDSAPQKPVGQVSTKVTTGENESETEDSGEGAGTKPVTNTTPVTTPAPVPTPAPTTNTTPPATTKKSGPYKDGSYTGNAADAYYGIVQVKAAIQNGYITGITFLSYPNDRRTSQNISAYATPILRSEAIQAQSANVDIVSGATDTSMAFQQSLASALAQAK